MAGGWRIASGLLLVPVAVVGLAGCSTGTSPGTASQLGSMANASSGGALTAATLRGALLTRVNGVAAAAPASIGEYSSMTAAAGKQAASAAQVTPRGCAGAATAGFNPSVLAGAPAAAVTFQVGTNGVSEVLVASSAKSASAALTAHVPAQCSRYEEKIGGKSYAYRITEQAVAGIGKQARVLNAHPEGAAADDIWSLIYRAAGFVGTVTVVGPNASEQAVKELGQQAYAFAAKSLS
jgi:hypothetical protein